MNDRYRILAVGILISAISFSAAHSWAGIMPPLGCKTTATLNIADLGDTIRGDTDGVVYACTQEVANVTLFVETTPGDPDAAPVWDTFEGPAPLDGNSGATEQDDTFFIPDCFTGTAKAAAAHVGGPTDEDWGCNF